MRRPAGAARRVASAAAPVPRSASRNASRVAQLALVAGILAVLAAAAGHADAAGAGSATGTAAAAAPASGIEISDRAYAIARQLRCPVCTAESVADSNAEIAGEMRRLIQQQLDAGKSQAQIIDYFRQRYGDWILLDPPKTGVHLVVWILPVLAALAGLVALAVLVRRWRSAADRTPAAAPEDLERVRSALRAQEDEG